MVLDCRVRCMREQMCECMGRVCAARAAAHTCMQLFDTLTSEAVVVTRAHNQNQTSPIPFSLSPFRARTGRADLEAATVRGVEKETLAERRRSPVTVREHTPLGLLW